MTIGKNKNDIKDYIVNSLNEDNTKKLYTSLSENINIFEKIFNNDDTFKYRFFENQYNPEIKCCILYIEGMINREIIYRSVIDPIVGSRFLNNSENAFNALYSKVIISNDLSKTDNLSELIKSIISGDTILLTDDVNEAIMIGSKGWRSRSIEEPESEKAIRAPREGFTESLMINLSLIRRKIKTPGLKFNFRVLGVISQTKICISYIDGIVNEKILQELNKRLDNIKIDAVLATSYIQESITDHPFSIFETIGYTERPDVLASKLLEGRIGIFVDGTPFVLTIPHILIESFQSNEDYYDDFYIGSFIRLLRIFGFTSTITITSLYVALTAFHKEMIPTQLLLSIYAARNGIPFPESIAAFGMIIVFEVLKEAGARMPTYIGQALSIVGALVIGEAAVDARLISAPMVIVIAFSSITSLMVTKVKAAALILRIIYLLSASFLGIYGMVAVTIGLFIHLFSMYSFGVPYMVNTDIISFNFQDLKDTYIRVPWWYMKTRPRFISAKNIIRNKSKGKKV